MHNAFLDLLISDIMMHYMMHLVHYFIILLFCTMNHIDRIILFVFIEFIFSTILDL